MKTHHDETTALRAWMLFLLIVIATGCALLIAGCLALPLPCK